MEINRENIKYRYLRIDEISVMVDYRILFLKELQGEQSADKEQVLREELYSYFEKAFLDESFVALIAEIDNQPIGFGGMVVQKIPGNFNLINGLAGYILNMFTLPEFRKNGIAGEILDRLVKKGKEFKLGKIYLHASKDGISLYKKYGFKQPDSPVLQIT